MSPGSPSRRRLLRDAGAGLLVLGLPAGVSATDDRFDPARGERDVDIHVTEIEERDEDEVMYLPEEDAVRYVRAWRSTNREEYEEPPYPEEPPEREPVYTTTPWERWGETQTMSVASRVAAEHVADETDLNHEQVAGGISSRVPDADRGAVVSVRDPDSAGLALADLAAVTPESVHVTYVLDDREYDAAVPVFVQIQPEVETLEGTAPQRPELSSTTAAVGAAIAVVAAAVGYRRFRDSG